MQSDFERKKNAFGKSSSRMDGPKNNKSDEMIWDETKLNGWQTECIKRFCKNYSDVLKRKMFGNISVQEKQMKRNAVRMLENSKLGKKC